MTKPEKRQSFETNLGYFAPATIALVVLMTALFGWQMYSDLGADSDLGWAEFWICDPVRILQGEIWRLASSAFVHATPDHLVGNVVMLYIAGMALEHGLGGLKTAAVFFLAAILENISGVFLNPEVSHLGSSGGVFGLIGGLVAFLFLNRHRYYVRDKRIAVVFLAWSGYSFVTAAFAPLINNFAHVSGFVFGVATVMAFSLKDAKSDGFTGNGN